MKVCQATSGGRDEERAQEEEEEVLLQSWQACWYSIVGNVVIRGKPGGEKQSNRGRFIKFRVCVIMSYMICHPQKICFRF